MDVEVQARLSQILDPFNLSRERHRIPEHLRHLNPMITIGDGNCLYRSLSRVVSGDEKNWGIIKLGVLSKAVSDESVLIEKVRIHPFHILGYTQCCCSRSFSSLKSSKN